MSETRVKEHVNGTFKPGVGVRKEGEVTYVFKLMYERASGAGNKTRTVGRWENAFE